MKYQLAQVNIARFKVPAEDPVNADFVNNLDRINAIAEAQDGFVWRFKGAGNNALDIQPFKDPNMAINMSVWQDMDSLMSFVYRNVEHRTIMRRRKEWFDKLDIYMVLWWIEQGTLPTTQDALDKLAHLTEHGPSQHAFTFAKPFDAPSASSKNTM
ncbi:DUF3291 domain-containing protein [Glaciecola siphonariae]|uniref:DUF3291 domain-containing protein n=1 Tax=Glaciecola siphonariae TaxID=521012 RepID=A0ABV9LV85_9ALTE